MPNSKAPSVQVRLTIQRTAIAAFIGFCLSSMPAKAASFGLLRSLQHGPIGDSPQFGNLKGYEAEGAIDLRRTWGDYSVNGDPDSKVTATSVKSRIQAGGGLTASKSFAATAYVDMTVASDYDEERKRTDKDVALDGGLYHHELGVLTVFKSSPLVVGGGLGMLLVGSEQRELIYDGDKYKSDITSAAMPVIQLFGGVSTKEFEGTIGVRFFSMGKAVVTAMDPSDKKYEYDIVRRNPGELHADGVVHLGDVDLAASLAYVLTGQASEQIDEFSMNFVQTGAGKKERSTGGDRRNEDHVEAAAGLRFEPNKMIGVLGGLSYIQSSYKDEAYASLENENLGAIRLDVGTDVHIQQFSGFFHAGYQLDSTASFTVKDASRSETSIDRTQKPPLEDGDKVKMTQGAWQLTAGGGMAF